jgi:hypothetical protein
LTQNSNESKLAIWEQHDEFIKARENLESIEYMYRKAVIAATPIVIGTSGVLMKSNLQSKHNLGEQFGALLTDESSMPEGGEEVCKMMNLLQQGIITPEAYKIFIGDLTQEGPSGNTQVHCWPSAEYIKYTSLAKSMFELMFSSLKLLSPTQLDEKVVFVNALRTSHRIGPYVAAIINAIVDEHILTHMPWVAKDDTQPRPKVRRTTAVKVEVMRSGEMTSLRPALRGNIARNSAPLVFYDLEFYRSHLNLLQTDWFLGHSRYCMVGTFIASMMMLRCGALAQNMDGPEKDVNVVLASGSYRAQCTMVCHCARMLLQRLPVHKRQVIMERSVLQTGTTTSQQSSTTRDTIVLWPVLLQKHTTFGCKAPKMVNVFSRHIGVLCLIKPWDQVGQVPPEVRKFHDLLNTHAFKVPEQTTDLSSLVSDILEPDTKENATTWARSAFEAWVELHAELRIRLESHKVPGVLKLDDDEEGNCQNVHVTADCAASSTVGSNGESPVASTVSEAPREIWNYMAHAMETLVPGLQAKVHTVTVCCQQGLQDLQTLQPSDRMIFEAAVYNEFPVGKKLAGTVLDLTVNYKNWKDTPYLYACVVGRELQLQWQQFESFRATMELLLFTCAKIVLVDESLKTICCTTFGAQSCTFILAWQLHKVDLGTDGSVVTKLEGGGGRIDYHIVAECRIGAEVVRHDVGHIYHTTNWKQNTFHSLAPTPHCTRALVVCAKPSLVQCFRHAVGAAWLSLSVNPGHRECCVLPRDQKHPDDFVSDAPDEYASAGVQSSPLVFPCVPVAGASEESNLHCRRIIAQFQLVCTRTSSKQENRQMVRRLVFNWHPDRAVLMQRDSKVSREVCAFLTDLCEKSSLL